MRSKIPTIVGLLILILSIGSIIFLFEYFSRIPTKAAVSNDPKNIQITNLSDTVFTVNWQTEAPTTGIISVNSVQQKNIVFYDERDSNIGKLGKYTTHFITARNLTPKTEYSVKIVSNGKTFLNINEQPYLVHTAPVLNSNSPGLEPAYGNVINLDNQPAVGAIVFLTLDKSQTLSALVKNSGSWLIPLNLTRTNDLQSYLASQERINETINIILDNQTINATTDTLNDSPVPSMIMGKSYDFRALQANLGKQQILKNKPTILGSQTIIASNTGKVSLVTPSQGAALPTALPLIQGTGLPGKSVLITIGITKPVTLTTKVGADGVWRATPAKQLGIGKQSVTITSVNSLGKPEAITHTFEILKSGTQVLGVATPSGTLTPTPEPIPTDELEPTDTPNSTISPTNTATPTPVTTGQDVPVSGNTSSLYLLMLIGGALIAGGTLLFIF